MRVMGRVLKLLWPEADRGLKLRCDVILQPIIFVTMFVFLFCGAMAGMNRHQYLQFVLPGIAVQTIVFASMGSGLNLNTDITKGVFDRFRSLPIARSAITPEGAKLAWAAERASVASEDHADHVPKHP